MVSRDMPWKSSVWWFCFVHILWVAGEYSVSQLIALAVGAFLGSLEFIVLPRPRICYKTCSKGKVWSCLGLNGKHCDFIYITIDFSYSLVYIVLYLNNCIVGRIICNGPAIWDRSCEAQVTGTLTFLFCIRSACQREVLYLVMWCREWKLEW